MYYVWQYKAEKSTKWFECGIEQFENWFEVDWQGGKKITQNMPDPLRYFGNNKLGPNDYPVTGGIEFLVSSKVYTILKNLNVLNIDVYDSIIIYPDGKIVEDYYSLNILNILDCVDVEKSEIPDKDDFIYKFKKLVLDYNRIPGEIKLFRLFKRSTLAIAHQEIVDACENQKAAGIEFIPVSEYEDFGI